LVTSKQIEKQKLDTIQCQQKVKHRSLISDKASFQQLKLKPVILLTTKSCQQHTHDFG